MLKNIRNIFYEFKNKVALVIGNTQYTYNEFASNIAFLTNQFKQYGEYQKPCIILSNRTVQFYVGMMACFFSGMIYTPINIKNSTAKIISIINQVSDAFIFIGDIRSDLLLEILPGIKNANILCANKSNYLNVKNASIDNRAIYIGDATGDYRLVIDDPIDHLYAYLFFTSGSTGKPKAIPISYRNIAHYLKNICSVFAFSSLDQFIQLSDIAFDISIHEILVSLITGGTLYVFDDSNEITVSHFIIKNEITQCILVPSTMPIITKQCQFYGHTLKSLKRTLVCGEAFPIAYAKNWESIAPKSEIVNLYGPTEATVCCTYHVYRPENNYDPLKILPIGHSLGDTALSLAENELVIEGGQVSSGYWYVENQAVSPFQFNREKNTYAYSTGDYAVFNPEWGYLFLGRRDDQWKIKGYRIEKNEIESALRENLNADDICVTAIFDHSHNISNLRIFSTQEISLKSCKKIANNFFPVASITFESFLLNEIPKLPNGKIDYKKLSDGSY